MDEVYYRLSGSKGFMISPAMFERYSEEARRTLFFARYAVAEHVAPRRNVADDAKLPTRTRFDSRSV
jgi:hypothetical protein